MPTSAYASVRERRQSNAWGFMRSRSPLIFISGDFLDHRNDNASHSTMRSARISSTIDKTGDFAPLWAQTRMMVSRCCTGFPCWWLGRWLRCRSSLSFDRTNLRAGSSRLSRRWSTRSVSPIPSRARSRGNIAASSLDRPQARRVGLSAAPSGAICRSTSPSRRDRRPSGPAG
jgi:hypothetical protein